MSGNRRRFRGLEPLVVAVLVLLAFLWAPSRRRPAPGPAAPDSAPAQESLYVRDLDLTRQHLDLNQPTRGEPEPPHQLPPSPTKVVPTPPRPPHDPIDPEGSPSSAPQEPSIDLAALESADMVLRPREMVQPRVPEQVIWRRKIDDSVLLQALVGTAGQVLQVQVLRSIPNCDECTQSAVDAVKRYRYEPPIVGGQPSAVWTNVFELRFTYRR